MDLRRMLRMCHEGQWDARMLDFSQHPRHRSRDDEMVIVQHFTDMAQIERLAGALFVEQQRRVEDPILKEIFATFVEDEIRHAEVAGMLAKHYDVHRFAEYRTSPSLARFFPHFLDAIRHLSDDVANTYITFGELLLDIALLRSIDDFVDDALSAQAMELINRDESRHIAIDYHMVGFYASDAYRASKRVTPKKPVTEYVAGARSFAAMLRWGRPFLRDVFFAPMQRIDPTGVRLREAFKRMQILGTKPGVSELPFMRYLNVMLDLFNRPQTSAISKAVIARIVGTEPEFMNRLTTDEELEQAHAMSFEQLAEEALAVKRMPPPIGRAPRVHAPVR